MLKFFTLLSIVKNRTKITQNYAKIGRNMQKICKNYELCVHNFTKLYKRLKNNIQN